MGWWFFREQATLSELSYCLFRQEKGGFGSRASIVTKQGPTLQMELVFYNEKRGVLEVGCLW